MYLRKFYTLAILLLAISFSINSCTQVEGIGGNSHIKGKLIEKYYNEDYSVFQYEKPAKDEDLFILFGDNLTVGENTSTSYTGDFEINYLWPGQYELYYFSEDSTELGSDESELTIAIDLAQNETIDLDTLYALKTLEWDEGFATIKGNISMINYKQPDITGNREIKDEYPAQDYDVFIRYNSAEYYNDAIKTQEDGTFVFSNLLMGHYEIITYSEDVEDDIDGLDNIILLYQFDITSIDQVITTEQIIVEKS